MGKKLSQEVKCEAIRMVEEQGMRLAQVSADLGIGRTTLDRWLKE